VHQMQLVCKHYPTHFPLCQQACTGCALIRCQAMLPGGRQMRRCNAAWVLNLSVSSSVQIPGRFYLIEDAPKFTRFMSEPIKPVPDTNPLDTPGYFLAGILKGYLASAGFPAECAPPVATRRCATDSCASRARASPLSARTCGHEAPCRAWCTVSPQDASELVRIRSASGCV
jgi:Transport protein particle (TRAPP) component